MIRFHISSHLHTPCCDTVLLQLGIKNTSYADGQPVLKLRCLPHNLKYMQARYT